MSAGRTASLPNRLTRGARLGWSYLHTARLAGDRPWRSLGRYGVAAARHQETWVMTWAPRPGRPAALRLRRGSTDLWVLRQAVAGGYEVPSPTHAERLTARYEAILAEGRRPLVIDAGAYTGISTIAFASALPEAQVVAVEPSRANHAMLTSNVEPFPRVDVVLGGVSSTRKALRVVDDPDGRAWALRTEASAPDGGRDGNTAVPGLALADLLNRHPDAVPLLLKVDIEGAETELFTHEADAAFTFPFLCCEPHDWAIPFTASSRPFLVAHTQRRRDLLVDGDVLWSVAIDPTDEPESSSGDHRDGASAVPEPAS